MISPEFLLFVAFAIFVCGIGLSHMEDDEHRDARKRNPRTWDDES